MCEPCAPDTLLEAVRGLRLAEPELGLKQGVGRAGLAHARCASAALPGACHRRCRGAKAEGELQGEARNAKLAVFRVITTQRIRYCR